MSPSTSRIAFITEGGPEIGLGHVSRCLALARAVASEGGGSPSFLLPRDERVLALLQAAGVTTIPVAWPADPRRAVEALEALQADTVVVDSYAASPEFLTALRGVVGQVVAVDDLATRPLPVDVIVNGGVSAESLPYPPAAGATLLLGPRYALLDPGYAETPHRERGSEVVRILICLGGGRHADAMLATIQAADAVLADGVIEIVVGALGDAPELQAGSPARHRVVIHRNRFGLRDLMLAADVAVSGAGMTLYELAATATPVIAVRTAENQRRNVEGFERAGVAVSAGAAGDPGLSGAIRSALRRLLEDRALSHAMGARGRELVDGHGALRAARAILRAPVSRSSR